MYTCTCKSFIHMSYWKKRTYWYILYTWMQAINCLIVSVGSNGLQHYSSVPSKMPWSYWSHARWAWLAWNPWRIPHCFRGESGACHKRETWGAYYGKPGRPPSSMFFVSWLIDFNMIQSPQLRTAIFFIIVAMLRNGFVDAIKPNRQKF